MQRLGDPILERESELNDEIVDSKSEGRKVGGRCLCGAIRFEIDGPSEELEVEFCHCSRCRKATGSTFLPSIHVPRDRFHFVSGQDEVRLFQLPIVVTPPPYTHAFCGICGSPMPFFHVASETIAVPVGALGDGFDPQILRHIYSEYKVPWYRRIESAPNFSSKQIRDLRRRIVDK